MIANVDCEILGIFFTLVDKRYTQTKTFRDYAEEYYPEMILENVINIDVKLEEASMYKENIFKHKAGSKGALAYMKLVNEMLKRL